MTLLENLRLMGARKIISEAANATKDESLLILTDEAYLDVAKYFVSASIDLGLEDINVQCIPKRLRPFTKVSKFLEQCIRHSDIFLYIIERMPEDSHLVYGDIWNVAKKSKCKYLTMHEPRLDYFEIGGVLADYEMVESKGRRLVDKLKDVEKVEVKSDIGTDVTFLLDQSSSPTYRSPSYKFQNNLDTGVIQIPEGEGGRNPVPNSLNGTLVIDGAITGLGIPPKPLKITFENGKPRSISGDRTFLDIMLDYARREARVQSLLEMNAMTEFSIGFNDWARFDSNTSNCEKVSGGMHFGLGNTEGEWFDNILTHSSVNLIRTNGARECLISDGQLNL